MGASGIGPVGRATDQWSTRTGREPPDEALFHARAQATQAGTTQAGQAGQTPPQTTGPSAAEVALDLTQLTLDVAGIFDPTPISDGANTVISLFRGDWSGAAISAVSMVPYIGDTAKLAKLPRLAETLGKVADLVRANPAAAAALRGAMEKLGALLNKAPIDSLPEAVRGPVQTLKGKFDEAMSAIRSSEAPASQPAAVPAGAADGANGGGPATGARTGAGGARATEGESPPTAAGGAGGSDGPGNTGGGSRPTASGPDGPEPEPTRPAQRQDSRFDLDENKHKYFFGEVEKPNPSLRETDPNLFKKLDHNYTRSQQIKNNLERIGIKNDEAGRARLKELFDRALDGPAVETHTGPHGTTITREIVEGDTKLQIKYFYENGDTSMKPKVVTIIPKIMR